MEKPLHTSAKGPGMTYYHLLGKEDVYNTDILVLYTL